MTKNSFISSFRAHLVIVSILGIFFAGEIGVRLQNFGLSGITHWKRYDPSPLADTFIITPVENPSIKFRLKPSLNTYFRGAPFSTNGSGFRDRPFSISKTPGTKRVAVLGASMEMGTGVRDEEAYSRQLQKLLDVSHPHKFEILNFAVGSYNYEQLVYYYEEFVAPYEPDIIFIPVGLSQTDEWNLDQTAPEGTFLGNGLPKETSALVKIKDLLDLRKKIKSFSFFYLLLNNFNSGFSQAYLSPWPRRTPEISLKTKTTPLEPNKKTYRTLLEDFIEKRHEESIRVILVSLKRPKEGALVNFLKDKENLESWIRKQKECYFIDTHPELDDKIDLWDCIYLGDNHPNAKVHRLYAEVIYKHLLSILQKPEFENKTYGQR